jgi:hypothetical protein
VSALYETDIVLWSKIQAELLRCGGFAELDVQNIAEEIEDVGKSEQREFLNRMSVLLSQLLIWQFQPTHRRNSCEATIKTQRRIIQRRIEKIPSLRSSLDDASCIAVAYDDALASAVKETGMPLAAFPQGPPWRIADIVHADFFPETPKPNASLDGSE